MRSQSLSTRPQIPLVSVAFRWHSLPSVPDRCRGAAMPRPRAPLPALTKRSVQAAAPRPTRWLLFDGLVHGFALKVEPSGAKVWVVQKSQRGRSVRVTIGCYPDLTVEQARREAQAIVAKLARGGDPTTEKHEAIDG